MNKKEKDIFYALVLALSGIVLYRLSGEVSGFFVVPLLLGVVLYAHLAVMMFIVIYTLLTLTGRRRHAYIMPRQLLVFAGLVICDILIYSAFEHTHTLEERSFAQGEKVAGWIEAFHQREGRYPFSLQEISLDKDSLPAPFINGSSFFYSHEKEAEGFFLQFPSAFFRSCYYDSTSKQWWCD